MVHSPHPAHTPQQVGILVFDGRALEIIPMPDAVEPVVPRAGCPDSFARYFVF